MWGIREKNTKWSCNVPGVTQAMTTSFLLLPFPALPMHGKWECSQRSAAVLGSVVMGRWVILKGQSGTWGECLGMHWSGSSCPCSQTTLLSTQGLQSCQLPLEGSWFLQEQDICTVPFTTPETEVATDPAAQPVGTFHPGAHQWPHY